MNHCSLRTLMLGIGLILAVSTIASAQTGCSPCLWYSGDWDPLNPNANEQFNSDVPWDHNDNGQVFVPVVATPDGNSLHKHVQISSITFNESASGIDDFTTMTYELRTGVGNGIPGAVLKSGNCISATAVLTGRSSGGQSEYAFTCVPAKPIKIAIGTIYWINTTPTFTVSNFAFLDDVEDTPAPNQFGWGDDLYNSFFYDPAFEQNFQPTWGPFGSCHAVGCDAFSVAIAGSYED
jgi:hypothetical protein